MRTGVWGWCGPPRRRRRRDPSPSSPPPPPPALSLCPAPPMPKPPPLADFAESVGDEAGLSDMDFSALDDTDFGVDDTDFGDVKQVEHTPGPMIMDAVSKKWMGNESEFERFHKIVAELGKDEQILPDQSVFDVSEETLRRWQQNGEEHNKWFTSGTKGQATDIRELTEQFSKRVERRKGTS